MVKHTQTICRQFPDEFLSVFDHFVNLALKGLIDNFLPCLLQLLLSKLFICHYITPEAANQSCSYEKVFRKYTPNLQLLCNFVEITLRHGCSHVNLLHIFRTPFPNNTSGWLAVSVTRKTENKI